MTGMRVYLPIAEVLQEVYPHIPCGLVLPLYGQRMGENYNLGESLPACFF